MTRILSATLLLFWMTSTRVECEPLPDTPPLLSQAKSQIPLPNTILLTSEKDLSWSQVIANDEFLDRELAKQRAQRSRFWNRNPDDSDAYIASVAANQKRLREILGLHRDPTANKEGETKYDSATTGLLYQSQDGFPLTTLQSGTEVGPITIHEVTWPVFDGIYGRGLLLSPEHFRENIIAIPDTSQSPIDLIISDPGQSHSGYAYEFARRGARVFIPTRITRDETRFTLTDREWLHRSAFVLGRTILGYELHKIFAIREAITDSKVDTKPWKIIGWGAGGMLALYAGATNPSFESVYVSGYFGNRESLWKEPFDHHLFGLLREFGDADIASLIVPRTLILEHSRGPDFFYRVNPDTAQLERKLEYASKKGKPGFLQQQSREEFDRESTELLSYFRGSWKPLVKKTSSQNNSFSNEGVSFFLGSPERVSGPLEPIDLVDDLESSLIGDSTRDLERKEIERHLHASLLTSSLDRKEYLQELDTSSLEKFATTVEPYRNRFAHDVVGEFPYPLAAPQAKSRAFQESQDTISYELTLEVFEGLFVYGILTLPKELPLDGSETRPVVVCQHGLEGTPQNLVGEEKFRAYRAYATRLAEEGFITFAPQNGYKYFDHFRLQQFKAQTMGKSLFSLIVPKHRQITEWLSKQPYVDGSKIAFYGLSYGGKSAMRIPPLVDKYCLSICSGDFNEWVWKNAAIDSESLRYSYANKGEYEIFEWNLGGTFNYSEMATLICPRPFMVERGHFDGVAPDEKVAYEFAKVRNLYQAKLGIGDRCEIEWFAGPHRINGDRTLKFLRKHLGFEQRHAEPGISAP